MDPVPQPPYNDSDIQFFARRQLGHDQVPKGYLEELDTHLSFFPHDYLFRLSPHTGTGYGLVDCLEAGCDGMDIILKPSESTTDTGRSSGVGGLAAFQDHIIESDHEHWREKRLKEDRKKEARRDNRASIPDTASQLEGSSGTSIKRPASPLSDQKSRDPKTRRVDAEIITLGDSKAPIIPSKAVRTKPIVPNRGKIYIDLDSEIGTDDIVMLDQRPVPLKRTMDTDSSAGKHTSSTSNSNLMQPVQSTSASQSKQQSSQQKDPTQPTSGRRPLPVIPGLHWDPDRPPGRWLDEWVAEQKNHAPILPPSIPAVSLPSLASTASRPSPIDSGFRNPSHSEAPILINHHRPGLPASYRSRPHDSVNMSNGGTALHGIVTAGSNLPDLSITHVQLPANVKNTLGFNQFGRPGAPELGHISVERQLFFKLAVDNARFEHNTTLEEARKALGIGESSGALMDGLAMPLMPHQLIGVSWMLKQEKGRHSGGILGDEMGMGKTMQMIATMVKNKSTDPKIKSTLILAPLGLLTQWREEIEEKTTGDFRILLYHGSHYKPTSRKEITKYDVVVTTLSTLSREWFDAEGASKKRKQEGISDDEDAPVKGRMGPLLKIKWYRVVIDEAQNIRNQQSVCSRAVCSLQTTYRWSLTGTPIFNGLWDIFPLLRFLCIRPYNDKLEFRNHIAQYEKNRPDLAGDRAQAVLLTCMLRRQKTTELDGKPLVTLPPKTIENQMLEMTPRERDIYDGVEKQIQAKFNKFLKKGTVSKNYAHVFVLLLRLRQACGHPSLVTEEGEATQEEETPEPDELDQHDADTELGRAVSRMGQEWVDTVKKQFQDEAADLVAAERRDPTSAAAPECPICNDPLDDTARITKCGHVFCEGCIDNLIESDDPGQIPDERIPDPNKVTKPCPDCRRPIGRPDTYLKKAFLCPSEDEDDDEDDEMPDTSCLAGRRRRTGVIDDSDDEDSSDGGFVPSTKMIWLLEELNRVKKENPDDKTIVISQWTTMLDLVATYLSRHGYEYVRYQGSMSTAQRNDAVRTFRRDPDVPIMLMSLKCGGVGLNLTRGNRVISLDLAWSPATEAQAFDRVHRLGQVKDVFVKRVMINRTVEQRISELQRVKQSITDHALGEGSGKKLQRLTVSQLANLFNLDTTGNRRED